jgi:hypothetical protein
MFIKGSLRDYERSSLITPIRYSLSGIDTDQLKKTENIAVSVDISEGGIGLITDYPLQPGHVVIFRNTVKRYDFPVKQAAVVRWAGKINGQCRAGLKFL